MPQLCLHCGKDSKLRNPSGNCDHLNYPENCKICDEIQKAMRTYHITIENDMHKIFDCIEESFGIRRIEILAAIELQNDILSLRLTGHKDPHQPSYYVPKERQERQDASGGQEGTDSSGLGDLSKK